jgi:Mg/Co/Ni transporter MgtE
MIEPSDFFRYHDAKHHLHRALEALEDKDSAKWFNTTPDFWIKQALRDLENLNADIVNEQLKHLEERATQ